MKNKDTLRKVLRRVKRYMPLIVLSTLLAALSVAGTLSIPIIIGNAIDFLVMPNGSSGLRWSDIIGCLLTAGIIAGITAFLQWLMNVINNRIAFNVVRDLRGDAFEHIERLPFSYLDSASTGDIVSRIISDADQFADGLLLGFSQLFTGAVTILGTLMFMLTLDPLITLAVVLLTPISLFAAKRIAGGTYSMFKKRSETLGEQTAFIDEIIGNQKTVKAFCREDESTVKFEEINRRLEKYSLKATFWSSLTNPVTRFVNALVYAAVGVFGAISAIGGGITVGALSCFLSYANQYTKPFNEISGLITELQSALAAAARIFELIEAQPELPDQTDAAVLEDAQGEVSLRNVDFSYTPERELIKNFNLNVRPGQRIAIVGPTGCGKTTVINLLMRFYDVYSGSIEVDGNDIRGVTRDSLRRSYGMVLQDTWLRHGTVRENISMNRPGITDEDVINAAKAAHAHSFIKRLPDGYDTVISGDGGGISQGQKQLICIARVMAQLPPMLILDEATSSIDSRTEMRIQRAFGKMMKGRTSFIVAHRLSTIRDADIIIVMNDGHIIETGNHDELIAAGGFYYKLYNSSFESA
ncbi:MAG: ABC transporter ATP-binding protein/permease [Ruminiclostridium sp.]|nr:ABC transporter ATP-binding protein/permease [Ruminiclostridium sp.]